MSPTAAELEAALTAFLRAHSLPQAVPAVLLAEGETLYRRCDPAPPPSPLWGRFLVALGQLAAESVDDPVTASRYFLRAVADLPRHGDAEAATTAGYNQGVLFERSDRRMHAQAAYRAAAELGLGHPPPTANALRAAMACVRLVMAADGALDAAASSVLKRAWLVWLELRRERSPALDDALAEELGRTLCAFLLPEDDPLGLAPAWLAWPPAQCACLPGSPDHGDARILEQLFAASAEAADRHLGEEGADPGRPYRLLHASLLRSSGGADDLP
jgi:hypothetical protein